MTNKNEPSEAGAPEAAEVRSALGLFSFGGG
jgi:hypothetical protein